MTLTLSLSGITTTLNLRTTFQDVRTEAPVQELAYTAAGTAVHNGITYEAKHIWGGSFFVDTAAQKDALLHLWALQQAGRRSGAAISTYEMLIQDRSARFFEPPSRTRATVSGDTVVLIPPTGTTILVGYFAQFRGVFVGMPEIETYDVDRWSVSLSITETSKVLAS